MDDGPLRASDSRIEATALFADEAQGSYGLSAADAIGTQAGVSLEIMNRATGEGAEDAIRAAAVEADMVQRSLEVRDVVAAQHWSVELEEAIAEVPAGLDEYEPGRLVTVAADQHTSLLLE